MQIFTPLFVKLDLYILMAIVFSEHIHIVVVNTGSFSLAPQL